jgi:hypothetical protein
MTWPYSAAVTLNASIAPERRTCSTTVAGLLARSQFINSLTCFKG